MTNFLANVIIISSVLYMIVLYTTQLNDGKGASDIVMADTMGSLVYFGSAMYAFEVRCTLYQLTTTLNLTLLVGF